MEISWNYLLIHGKILHCRIFKTKNVEMHKKLQIKKNKLGNPIVYNSDVTEKFSLLLECLKFFTSRHVCRVNISVVNTKLHYIHFIIIICVIIL